MIRKILGSFLRQYLFWVLFFNLNRLVFTLFLSPILIAEKISFWDIPGVFFYSIKLDLATASYFMVLPFLLLLIQTLFSPNWFNWLNKLYTGLMILFYSVTTAGEMGIYPEWKTKLNYKIIKYMSEPSEIYNSAETGNFFLLLGLFLLLSTIGIYAYNKWFYKNLIHLYRNFWFTLIFLLVIPPLMVLGMRGGTQAIPINQSESYFSRHNILNIISVNNVFNLYISVFENLQNFGKNPYLFMTPSDAREIVTQLYDYPKDTTIQILDVKRPNIVMIILESWSADLIESLGGKPGITPEFAKLEQEGLLFTEIYSSGARSEQGMASIFGGFPAHPISSLTVQPDKYQLVSSFPQLLGEQGFATAFYFGGQLIYGNIKGYIYYNKFDKIMEIYDFPDTLPSGKLGIHDTYTLDYLAQDLNSMNQPFFASLFTLSTHSPWDQPYEKPLEWGDNEREWINAALYTDHALGMFFQQAKKSPWYKNTLFILVADHSHNSYYNWHPHSKEYHKIPMLFCGEPIKPEYRGTSWSVIGNQHDLASTLLNQLEMADTAFPWSKDLFNPFVPQFAYYTNENGAGWIREDGYFTFDKHLSDCYFYEPSISRGDSLILEGKAYLQQVFSTYLDEE
jgi:phosphoglycerol transferase MdoB-like AlkP superfamily enzyme